MGAVSTIHNTGSVSWISITLARLNGNPLKIIFNIVAVMGNVMPKSAP